MITDEQPRSAVLVIGESLIDVIRGDAHEVRTPGGSPMNVACGLGLLGVPTRLLTHIAHDDDGDAILRRLREANVAVVDGSCGAVVTGTAVATLDSQGVPSYSFDLDWQVNGLSGLRIPQWVHTGSIATFLSPGADVLERFLGSVRGDQFISYDPNIRPLLLPSVERAFQLFTRFARLSDVVKLSVEDAAWLYPHLDADRVIDEILSLGPRLVVVTHGPGGAVLSTRGSRVAVPSPRVRVVDTVGAGDSFMAALLCQLVAHASLELSDEELTTIGTIACLAAAITCTRSGSQPPTLEELVVESH